MATDPILRRAIALTRLKYGDKTSAILQAMQEAAGIRKQSIAQAKAGAKYSTDAENYGQRAINTSFDGIRDAAAQSGAFMDKLSPVQEGTAGSALMAAIQNSRQNMPVNVANQRAMAIGESNSRAARARSGGDFAIQAANATFQGNIGKLRQQLAQTQDQAATATQTTYDSLLDKYNAEQRKGAELEERKRHNLAMENKKGKTGKNGPTREQRRAAQDAFDKYTSLYADKSIVVGEYQDANGKTQPKRWTLAQAKQGLNKSGKNVGRTSAVKDFERHIRRAVQQKIGKAALSYAVAQTIVWGGVGPKTYKQVLHRYGIRLPRFK